MSKPRNWLADKVWVLKIRWRTWRNRIPYLQWQIDYVVTSLCDDIDELFHEVRLLREENATLWQAVNQSTEHGLEVAFNEMFQEVN
jgi:hypothetical protein